MTGRADLASAVVRVAAGLAMVTGALQVLVFGGRHVIGRDFIWLSREYVWMTPLGHLLLFEGIAACLIVAVMILPRLPWAWIAGFLLGALGALSLVVLIPVHPLAAVVVAMGGGARVGSWLSRDFGLRSHRLGRLAIALGIVCSIVGLARAGHRGWTERQQIAALPSAAPGAPNVLVIILDTVRAASMSFHGYSRETTPHVAALAAEGVVFEHAFSTAPWTLPSHAGMFTGRYPSLMTADWREPMDRTMPTVAEVLAGHGYRTAGFVANHFYTSYESGIARGFEHYDDYRVTVPQVLLSTTLMQTPLVRSLLQSRGIGARLRALRAFDLRPAPMWRSHRKEAPEVTDEFLAWHARLDASRPFFAFLNYYDAHQPYAPPGQWRTKFGAEPTSLDRYDGAIAYIDAALGTLFRELEGRGALDRTLVILSSDHGELFGEHGLHGHGNSLYLPELHVPLVVRYPPRVPAGARVSAPVTLRDLAATALDITGTGGTSHPIPGNSWLAYLTPVPEAHGSAVIAEVSKGINTEPGYPVSRGSMRSIITDSLHYIRNGDGVEELYAWRTDAAESRNLSTAARDALDALRAVVQSQLR